MALIEIERERKKEQEKEIHLQLHAALNCRGYHVKLCNIRSGLMKIIFKNFNFLFEKILNNSTLQIMLCTCKANFNYLD